MCRRCLYDLLMSAHARASRWNLRVAPDDDIVVRKAADEADRELSDFIRTAAVLEAERILADRTVFTVEDAQWDHFQEILDRPPRVPAGLEELFSRPTVFE
jgi:uncharacterized protein (DUF1778 family)